ncbi:GGDEF domain-containing protein [Vibrio sp. S11_S32]|uniref:GGDEF domain-containing protein n=1 Tax=Vibrio sp. S11_S32 TaxID=2720225 RepID=UPI0016811497|nr:GGDEF domain-containing protein [Vibrio sp. S11_S32]MBD1574907.1 GGDEF domain-containing protein [Vibrio sp. S11_S32]
MIKQSVKNKPFLYLILTSLLCWITYTGITLRNYAEGVVSDMQGDLAVFYNANNAMVKKLELLIDQLPLSPSEKLNPPFSYNAKNDITGFNINPNQYAEFAGTLIVQGQTRNLDFNLPVLLHALDRAWAETDYQSPAGFFLYYGKNSTAIYSKLRYLMNVSAPIFTPERYRSQLKNQDPNETFILTLNNSFPLGEKQVLIITPIMKNGKLIADLGMSINLKQLMGESLGPWLSEYMAMDITYQDERFSVGENRFFPAVFKKQIQYHHFMITAYMRTNYITEYVLPWFIAMSLIMFAVYTLLVKQHKATLKFSSLSITDDLTGLYNKRVLQDLEFRDISSGTLYYLDINAFKQINDTYGHNVGDDALRFLAKKLTHIIRSSDIAVRLGGDEFLVVTNGKVLEPEVVLNKLKAEIDNVPFYQDVSFTLAIGYSHFDGVDLLHEAIHLADKAMYEQKRRSKAEY